MNKNLVWMLFIVMSSVAAINTVVPDDKMKSEVVADLFDEEETSDSELAAPGNVTTTTTVTKEIVQDVVPVVQKTFAIIKPDAVAAGFAGDIIKNIELNGFKILGLEKTQLSKAQAESFYAVHKARPFFKDLVEFMISGPVIVMALEKENAVQEWRDLMGATNPAKAEVGTMRKMFGSDMTHNATHGSDSVENAHIELEFFFPELVQKVAKTTIIDLETEEESEEL